MQADTTQTLPSYLCTFCSPCSPRASRQTPPSPEPLRAQVSPSMRQSRAAGNAQVCFQILPCHRATAGPGGKQRGEGMHIGTSETKASECDRAASARRAEPGSGRGGLAALPSLCLWLRLPSLPGRFPFSCRSLCTLRSLLMGQSLPEPSRSAPSLPVLSQPRVLSRFEQGSRTECVQLSVLPECAGKTLHPNPGLSLFCVDHRPGTSPLCFLICRMALAAPNSQGSLED